MSECKLSIIIPTYNLEHVIEKTFNSIKEQTIGFNNIELIFVDDCSSDNTYNIISKYSETYDNVTTIKIESNSNFAGRPRNIGLKNSNSNFVLFLDGDDQLLIDSCEVLYKHITLTDADIVIGGHINHYDNGRLEHIPPLYYGKKELFNETVNADLFKIMPAIGAKLFRKELLIKNNIFFPEYIAGEDLVFLLNSLINSEKVYVLNNFYSYYRTITKKSVTFSLNKNYFYGLITAYSLIADLFKKHEIEYNLQVMLLTNHLIFFTTQVMRAYSSNDFDNNNLDAILNSNIFNELSQKDIFKNNAIYSEFFYNMKNGYYNNHDLLKRITDKYKPEIKNEYLFLKEYNNNLIEKNSAYIAENNNLKNKLNNLENINNKLNEELNNIKEEVTILSSENQELKNTNNSLNDENNNLKDEINTIKSSKLWKLKNKL